MRPPGLHYNWREIGFLKASSDSKSIGRNKNTLGFWNDGSVPTDSFMRNLSSLRTGGETKFGFCSVECGPNIADCQEILQIFPRGKRYMTLEGEQ